MFQLIQFSLKMQVLSQCVAMKRLTLAPILCGSTPKE